MIETTQTVVDFIKEKGTVPFLADKPWHFRGWLLPYTAPIDDELTGRLAWWFEQVLDGLEDVKAGIAKIPQVNFVDAGQAAPAMKHAEKMTSYLDQYTSDGLEYLVKFILWGFGGYADLSLRDIPFEKQNEWLYRNLDVGILMQAQADVLGSLKAERKGKWNPTAFFPTPMCVVSLIAKMNFHDGMSPMDTVNDCCLGTGRMLLPASNYSLFLSGADIDMSVLRIAMVNFHMYAPWIVAPYSDELRLRALADIFGPGEPDDLLTKWASSKAMRRVLGAIQGLREATDAPPTATITAAPPEAPEAPTVAPIAEIKQPLEPPTVTVSDDGRRDFVFNKKGQGLLF